MSTFSGAVKPDACAAQRRGWLMISLDGRLERAEAMSQKQAQEAKSWPCERRDVKAEFHKALQRPPQHAKPNGEPDKVFRIKRMEKGAFSQCCLGPGFSFFSPTHRSHGMI